MRIHQAPFSWSMPVFYLQMLNVLNYETFLMDEWLLTTRQTDLEALPNIFVTQDIHLEKSPPRECVRGMKHGMGKSPHVIVSINNFYTPTKQMFGGMRPSICLSVRSSLYKMSVMCVANSLKFYCYFI